MRIIYDKFVILLLFSVFAVGFGSIISFRIPSQFLAFLQYFFGNCTVNEFMVFHSRSGFPMGYLVDKEM
jgi:hypothetical protein